VDHSADEHLFANQQDAISSIPIAAPKPSLSSHPLSDDLTTQPGQVP
jgi:hypothetical protein